MGICIQHLIRDLEMQLEVLDLKYPSDSFKLI